MPAYLSHAVHQLLRCRLWAAALGLGLGEHSLDCVARHFL